jgi:hypothetical protein
MLEKEVIYGLSEKRIPKDFNSEFKRISRMVTVLRNVSGSELGPKHGHLH